VPGCQKLQMTSLTQSGTGCFIAVDVATVGVEGLTTSSVYSIEVKKSLGKRDGSWAAPPSDSVTRVSSVYQGC